MQPVPSALQSNHWYLKRDGRPLQVPLVVARCWPTWVVPDTAGGSMPPGGCPVPRVANFVRCLGPHSRAPECVGGIDDDAHSMTHVAARQDESPFRRSPDRDATPTRRRATEPLVAKAVGAARPRSLRDRQAVTDQSPTRDRRAIEIRGPVAAGRSRRSARERDEKRKCCEENCGGSTGVHGASVGLGRGRESPLMQTDVGLIVARAAGQYPRTRDRVQRVLT